LVAPATLTLAAPPKRAADLATITTVRMSSGEATVFSTPQLFRLRDERESNLLRAEKT
jgi:hypothetical protein